MEGLPVARHERDWYGVRCIFRWRGPRRKKRYLYEERVTLWRAGSFDEAIRLAEAEAREYAGRRNDPGPREYLGLAQAYIVDDEKPGHGDEVFSLLRESSLKAHRYLDRYFDTGQERNGAG